SMARTVLRMDPDVVVLGEMRDEDTAQVMLRAAITGHLVFSTVHTHSATAIVTRLIDLGVSTSLLSSPSLLSCLVCQRLVPLLCHHCAKPLSGSLQHTKHLERWSPVLSDAMDHVKVRGVTDCRRCHGLGIAGRTVVAEIIWIDEAGRRYIQQNDILGWENNLRQNGWISYAERLLDLVKQGSCDPLDAEKLIGELGIEFHAAKATVHA
nr:Flp pilus assembly complex ATPase component TadA [Gammaproteobacteria bacterium]